MVSHTRPVRNRMKGACMTRGIQPKMGQEAHDGQMTAIARGAGVCSRSWSATFTKQGLPPSAAEAD